MLTVLIITKNEEEMIADCIESARNFADELLVVDSASTDKTAEIAQKLGAIVISKDFSDFSERRNFAATKAKNKWILYLDADERLTPEFKKEVQKFIQSDESNVAYFVKRKTYYFNKDWEFTDKVQRLFLKSKLKSWHGVVHETPEVQGQIGIIESPILHFTHRNLSQMLQKTNEWSEYEAELRFKSNHPVMTPLRFIRVMLTAFLDSYIKGKGYKNGAEGFIESIYQSFSIFITYAKLWERQIKE